ncbi:MAG: glycosyltransferase family 4 protein [Patescibacteria group bacterium]|nr:glycosyltransferase family 4 protein [Patescibacteria group bacterium]
MKIGIDVRLWGQTGVGRYIRNLILNLQKIDNKNEYVIFARKEDFQNLKSQISNPKWGIIETNIKWHSLREQIELPKLLNKENLDLVHFPYFSVPIFYNKPFVLTIHDLIIHHYPTGKASTLFPLLYYLKFYSYKYIIYKAAQKAKKIITPSISTKEEVMDHLAINDSKITVIYEAVDDNVRHQMSDIRYQDYGKYFLYVGNAYPHKNLDKLTEVFSDFQKDAKDVKLILVGSNDFFYSKLKQKVKKLNIEGKVIFKTNIPDSELSYLYENAIALVSPALMEGFGLPVLEAMANKCLVVCSDIPSFKEIAREYAVYFNPTEKKDIKDKLVYVYKNYKSSKFEKIVKRGYDLSRRFSWEKMATETLKVYESSSGV